MNRNILEGEDLRLWREFLRWSESIHAAVNRAVATASDLSLPEFEVLTRLWWEPERRLSQLTLTTGLGWSASRASHLLHRLEGRGFIDRTNLGQGRAREVILTPCGLTQLLGAFEAHGAAFRAMVLDRLSDDQRKAFLALMRAPDIVP